jgi:uracil-DNA glycosylase family 4
MDERLRQELAAWLEFYRELGIEDLYRRSPGSVPAERLPVPAQPLAKPAVPGSAGLEPGMPPSFRPPSPGGVALRSLSLFETPPPVRGPETLGQILEDLGNCQRCKLAAGRKTIVFGEGNPHAELVFIGEAPGADEDAQGLPFVGRAGQLLNRLIQFIGMKRGEVYICNIVKCRPPGNRTPENDEIETCAPFLFRQIEAIQPRLICCLGAPAVKTVLGIREGISKIRGRFYDFGQSKAFVTFHPAYILRNAREEKVLREDLEKIREFLKTRR